MNYRKKYPIYYHKYIKYKRKYLSLKDMKGQGSNSLVGYNIQKGIKDLLKTEGKPFIIADIELDEDEKDICQKLKVSERESYNFYGPINKDQIKYISDFLQKLGNDKKISEKVATTYFEKVIKPFLESLNKDSAWITIRATMPTDEFDLPRWHIDGYYYKVEEYRKKNKGIPKLVTTLKGPCTLLKETDKETREKFQNLRMELMKKQTANGPNVQFSKEFREELHKFLKDYPTITCSKDQAVVFVSNLAIHSEPPMHETRLFMSVLPGDKDDIKEMADNQKAYFEEIGAKEALAKIIFKV